MPYATQPYRPQPKRANPWQGAAYRSVVAQVRARAKAGEPCWFCGGGFNWALHWNHPGAFTAHHHQRIMDGGAPVPDSRLMAPAHRSCNARDGLRAQNARRIARLAILGQRKRTVTAERTSRTW